MTAVLEGGEWLPARPGRTLTTGKTRYPLYRRVDPRAGLEKWEKGITSGKLKFRFWNLYYTTAFKFA